VTEALEISRRGGPKPKISADRLTMPASLATVQFVAGQRRVQRAQLPGNAQRRIRIDLLVLLGKPAVNLNKLQLQSEPEPALVRHAG